MCGIIGVINKSNKHPVNEMVINQYQEQRERGILGFGIIFIDK